MKSRPLIIGLSGLALTFGLGVAHAGAIRATGRHIGKTSAVVAGTTANAAGAAAAGVATAGKATGGALKDGGPKAGKAIVSAPGAAAHGTARAGKAIWKAVW